MQKADCTTLLFGKSLLKHFFFSIIFLILYIASGLVGIGRLLSLFFETSYHSSIVITLLSAGLYTVAGGFSGIMWCNMLQGVFLLIMLIAVPLAGFLKIGSITPIVAAAQQYKVSLSLLDTPSQIGSALLLAFSWGLGYFGQPQILTNFMGIDNPKKIIYAKRVGMIWMILALTSSTLVGVVSLGFFKTYLATPEFIYLQMAQQLFHPFFVGLVICAILAATLSTMDTQILLAGTMFAYDLIPQSKILQKNTVFLARAGSVFACIAALALSWDNQSSVYHLVNYAWSGLGSAFGPLLIATLFFKKIKPRSAIASIILGATTSLLWPCITTQILPLLPGMLIASLCLLL